MRWALLLGVLSHTIFSSLKLTLPPLSQRLPTSNPFHLLSHAYPPPMIHEFFEEEDQEEQTSSSSSSSSSSYSSSSYSSSSSPTTFFLHHDQFAAMQSPACSPRRSATTIETPRLKLRQFKKSDLETFYLFRNDPEVARYQSWRLPYSFASAVRFVNEHSSSRRRSTALLLEEPQARPSAGDHVQIAIENKATGELIGNVCFHFREDDARQGTIGYTLARKHWGKGYAQEAVSALLDEYVFNERKWNLHRLVAECDVENNASWRLLERLGFRREAHCVENNFVDGRYTSDYQYGILAREWRRMRSVRVGAK